MTLGTYQEKIPGRLSEWVRKSTIRWDRTQGEGCDATQGFGIYEDLLIPWIRFDSISCHSLYFLYRIEGQFDDILSFLFIVISLSV